MRVDRRDFLRIGGAGALAAFGCNQADQPPRTNLLGSGSGSGGVQPGTILIDFTGLVLMEHQPSAMVVHLVDGDALSLGPHIPQLRVPSAAIDQGATKKPDPEHIKHEGEEFWVWDLKGHKVTTPGSPGGQPDLTLNETTVSSAEKPPDEAGWRSLEFVPNLRTLCGATKIVKPDALVSAITLTHGHLESGKPDERSVGLRTVWKFTHPDGRVLMRRLLTDRVRYSCPTNGSVTINVGSQPIVFQPGAKAILQVRNEPPEDTPSKPCPSPPCANINHFAGYFSLVDAQFTPTGAFDSEIKVEKKGQGESDVEPDYCPPARF